MKTFQDLVAEAKTRVREVTVDDVQRMVSEGSDFVLLDGPVVHGSE